MKKKTFSRLKIFALSLLLAEAMMLLILLLAQTGASAEVGGNQGASHKGTSHGAGNTGKAGPGGSDDQDADNSFYGRHWSEAFDLSDLPGGGTPDDFNGAGPSAGGRDGGQGSHAPDQFAGGSPYFFPGFSGQGGSQGGSRDGAPANDFGTHGDGGGDFTGDLNNFGKNDVADGADDGHKSGDSNGGGKGGGSDGPPGGQAGPNNPIRSAGLAPTSVPEPMSASLLIAGLAGAVLVRRYRRAKA